MWSLSSFYSRQLENEFNRAFKSTSMVRYIIGFPMVCNEFLNATSPFCPEEVRDTTGLPVVF